MMAAKTKRINRGDPFVADSGPQMRSGRAPLHRFIPYPNNARVHPPAELALLAQLIKKRGPDQPIVVDEDWVILKGHARREASLIAGLEDFPYVQRLGLSEDEKIAIRLEDNAVPLMASWSIELARGEIALLKSMDYDVSLLGFGDTQLVQFTTLPGPPGQFPTVSDDLHVDKQCPKCGFVGSGDWIPKAAKAKNGKKKR
jgi:hypothetical protein